MNHMVKRISRFECASSERCFLFCFSVCLVGFFSFLFFPLLSSVFRCVNMCGIMFLFTSCRLRGREGWSREQSAGKRIYLSNCV